VTETYVYVYYHDVTVMNCLRFINTYTLTAGPVLTNISKCQIETQTLSLRLKLWRKVYNSESPRQIFTYIVLYSVTD